MTDFHVEIVRLGKIEKHPNADALDITFVHGETGYPCIIKKDSFNEGDLAVYIPVDTTLPDRPEFAFLDPKDRRRLKAKKLRGFFSMGLVIPIPPDLADVVEGEDVAERLGITKYEPKVSSGAHSKILGGDCEPDPEHFTFHRYTDIEPLRRNARVLTEGEEVVLTEKTHGCFAPKTKITMADGTKKCIEDIQVGDYVAGVNKEGLIIPTAVLKTWANSTDKWIDIKILRRKLGRGNYFSKIRCTPNHQIATHSATDIVWKDACDLSPTDIFLMHKEDITVPELQKQILLGILLGDGHLAQKENHHFAYIAWGHKQSDSEYMNWIARGLGDLHHKSGAKRNYISGYGTEMLRDRTTARGSIWQTFKDFKCPITGKKVIPEWIVDELSPIAIAFWFMDDGSINYADGEYQDTVASFATCGFSLDECYLLAKALSRFNIKADVTSYGNRNRLKLNASEAEKLFLLIAPYIPSCMSRKLPVRYRGGTGWLPEPGVPQRYSQIVEQKLISTESVKLGKQTKSYDLTTETHNFFAHEVLVHNSNARFVHDGQRLWVGSRTQIKKPPIELTDRSPVWWRIALEYDLENKLRQFPGLVFFGEIFGPGIQDLTYGQSKPALRIFDVMDVANISSDPSVPNDRYLDHDDMVKVVQTAGLEMVPHLYRGAWNPKELLPLCEGKTTMGGVHCREGFVVKPVKERWDHRVGRVILKMVGEDYHTRKGG